MPYTQVIDDLRTFADPEKALILRRFFKTGKGQYGENDVFWGIVVPKIRKVAKSYARIPLGEVSKLIRHKAHEVRLCGLFILVGQYPEKPDEAYRLYLDNIKFINNWDLVDLSAPNIVGAHLYERDRQPLYNFAYSNNLWERRIAIISTFNFIRKGGHTDTFKIAEILLNDKHDLIHKAVGWMLREVGKRCSEEIEEEFLKRHARKMPRTMLRYALERFTPDKRVHYMGMGKGA